MKKRIWIVPRNDLEAVEIINLLRRSGEDVVESQQPWGASWERLEGDVIAQVNNLLAEHPDAEVVGVELAGSPRWNARAIDHHRYAEDDRSHELSSIEQIAVELGVELNRYQRLVAENDKFWISGLERAGASHGEIDTIRQADRCAQGVTPDDEAQAVRDIQSAERNGERVFVRTSLSSWRISPISDRLYGSAEEWLIAASNAWLYNGHRHHKLFALVREQDVGKDRDWVGGSETSGYAGFVEPSESAQALIRDFFQQ